MSSETHDERKSKLVKELDEAGWIEMRFNIWLSPGQAYYLGEERAFEALAQERKRAKAEAA
jgi:hypothetical protein